MNKELYIYHHLGLGDHIICNAIVRHYSKLNDKIFLFVKPHNFENVQYMYRDLNNIEYLIGDDFYAENFLKTHQIYNVLRVGFEKLIIENKIFDKSFYNISGLDFEERWSGFYMLRDMDKELEAFRSFNVKENEYIFIQEDRNRGFGVDVNRIKNENNLKIVSSDNDIKIFHMCYLIENAREVHVTESSFRPLIEHLNMKTDKLFIHRYARGESLEISTKKNWITVY